VASAGLFDDDGEYDVAVGALDGNNADNVTAGYCWLQDSSDTVVPTYLSHWQAAWTEQQAVSLTFDLSLVPGDVQAIGLRRQHDGGPGQEVWSGPAMLWAHSLQTLPPDLLVQQDEHFGYLDSGPFTADAMGGDLGYSLTVTAADGSTMALPAMDGPGPLPSSSLPALRLEIGTASPNPFNPSTAVRFRAAEGLTVQAQVTDLAGRRIATLPTTVATGTWQSLTWRGRSDDGRRCASGVYVIVLTADQATATHRVVLAK